MLVIPHIYPTYTPHIHIVWIEISFFLPELVAMEMGTLINEWGHVVNINGGAVSYTNRNEDTCTATLNVFHFDAYT